MSEDLEEQATEDAGQEEVSLRDALESAYEEVEEGVEAAPEEASAEPTDIKEDQGESEAEVSVEQPPILAPHSWSAENKEMFNSLPREVQEVVASRQTEMDKDYFRKSQEIASERKRYEGIDRVLDPYREQLQLEGIREEELVGQMLGIRKMLDTDPVRGLQWIAEQYGVSPQHLSNLPQQQADPRVAELQSQIGQLQGYLNQQQQVAQEQALSGINAEVANFRSETDENGNLTRPFFQSVEAEMVPLVQAYRAQYPNMSHKEILDRAYKAAVAANPDITAALEAQQKQVQAAQAAEKAAKAAKAGSSISGAPGGGTNSPTLPEDIRGALEAAWDMHS